MDFLDVKPSVDDSEYLSYQSLVSGDHQQLLDLIDQLRSLSISHIIALPQIIVCGDQSSGKSSVLQAASRIWFPMNENLCTRFATELILRRGAVESARVTIIPGSERSDEERTRLAEFKAPTAKLSELPALIEAAKEAMGLNSEVKAFSDDILRLEISGPEQPNLTLVDLPGLIHAENKQQTAKDVELVSSIVRSYMANTRSIILAVVSAKNDYANQIVTKLARNVDPDGKRTLGIITKPDTLHVGSGSERAFVTLAKNEDVIFRLGWHVLKNRDFNDRDCSQRERDEAEQKFFAQGIWTQLPVSILGIESLKPRLMAVLENQITVELPSLIRDVDAGIEHCRETLARLGEGRETLQEKQLYLVRIGRKFSSLVEFAVKGIYVDEFFGNARTNAGYEKRLRAVLQNLLLEFAADMRQNGHSQKIVDDDTYKSLKGPSKSISRSDFIDDVRELMRRSRGCELPGTFNPLIVGDLFYQQSRPWQGMVDRFIEDIIYATKTCLDHVLEHVADSRTGEGLLRELINPAMERYKKTLESKVAEIMRPHKRGHPITYNQHFTEEIQKARQDYANKDQARRLNVFLKLNPDVQSTYVQQKSFYTGELLKALNERTEADMD